MSTLVRRHSTSVVAVVLVVGSLLVTVVEARTGADPGRAARGFGFSALALPEPPGITPKHIRTVHPSLERIDAWISSVGAGVALGDLDGDGLPNDVCHVDPRFDKVIVSPAPSTGARYPLFTLDPPAALWDSKTMAPMGCTLGDLNADGGLDAVVYYWGRTPLLFVNRGGAVGASGFSVQDPVPTGERWFTNALTLADVDGDGRTDLVVGNYFQDGARILDHDDDELQTMQDSMSNSFNGGRSRVLRQTGSGFEDHVLPDRQGRGWTLAIGAADLDADLLPELFFARDFGPDRLLHNRSTPGRIDFDLVRGKSGFTVPSSKVLGYDSFKGMGVDFADVNGDQRLDIMVSNITTDFGLHESNFLFVSSPSGNPEDYVDESRSLGVAQAGWAWDVRFGDFDNDGTSEIVQATGFVKGSTNRWPELHELASGNDAVLKDPRVWPRLNEGTDLSGHQPNRFFARDGRGYTDVASAVGLDSRAVSRGMATADVDGDGDLDLVVANQWEPSVLYLNQCSPCGRSMVLNLRQSPAEPSTPTARARGVPAVGATATVALPDGRRLLGRVDGGSGHSGKNSAEIHLGLSDVDPRAPLTVELSWRGLDGGARARTVHLPPGRHDLFLDSTGDVQSR